MYIHNTLHINERLNAAATYNQSTKHVGKLLWLKKEWPRMHCILLLLERTCLFPDLCIQIDTACMLIWLPMLLMCDCMHWQIQQKMMMIDLLILSDYVSGTFLRACWRTRLLYWDLFCTKHSYAASWAGDLGLGLSNMSWIPRSTCLIVIDALQSSPSFTIERHTRPQENKFGWNSGGVNVHMGGRAG